MQSKSITIMLTQLGVLLMLIFLTACASPTNPSTTESQATETQAPQPSATEPPATVEGEGMPTAGLCANAYYPVRAGATWSYKSTGGPAGEYNFTDMITSVREDGFTLSTQIGELTRTQEWTCGPEGLAALQLGGAPAAMLNAQNIQLNLEVSNATGVTFPSAINVGDQWQQSFDVAGNVAVANEEGTATGNAQMNFTAVGNESVTVPAGTFEALKVEVNTTLNIDATYAGLSLPVTFSGAHTYWFVQGIGWVKATGTGNVLGNSFSETMELQSYNIP